MSLKNVKTSFRAYQLGSHGSSYSYCCSGHFTLVEARFNEVNKPQILKEMAYCGVSQIDCLHITSWDSDHCAVQDLKGILQELKPSRIEKPGYEPHSETAKEANSIIDTYKSNRDAARASIVIVKYDPPYIRGLKSSKEYGYENLAYWPKEIHDSNHNNNSTVKLYRGGSFNVLSTGDVEDHSIGRSFIGRELRNELDVLVLPHHGAETGFANKNFLKETAPLLAVCNSNFDNQFDHPADSVRDLLYKHDVPLFTTKTGDVVIRSTGIHDGYFQVINLKSNSEEVSCTKVFVAKKRAFLSQNLDTIRDRIRPKGYSFPKR